MQAAIESLDHPDPHSRLMDLLADAVHEAETFARSRGIADSLTDLQRLVSAARSGDAA